MGLLPAITQGFGLGRAFRGPSELALIASDTELERHLNRLADLGATDFYARAFGTPDEVARTREFLVAYARTRGA